MSVPISHATAAHYVWGDQCASWHLMRSDQLSVIQERMPPGTAEERHRHARSRQFFFVLAGELRLDVDGVEHTLAVGVGIEVAPGVVHQARNPGPGDAEFLVISQPPSHGDRETVRSQIWADEQERAP